MEESTEKDALKGALYVTVSEEYARVNHIPRYLEYTDCYVEKTILQNCGVLCILREGTHEIVSILPPGTWLGVES